MAISQLNSAANNNTAPSAAGAADSGQIDEAPRLTSQPNSQAITVTMVSIQPTVNTSAGLPIGLFGVPCDRDFDGRRFGLRLLITAIVRPIRPHRTGSLCDLGSVERERSSERCQEPIQGSHYRLTRRSLNRFLTPFELRTSQD